MTLHDEIEQIRRELNIPDHIMCNIFDISLEEYLQYRIKKRKPTNYQAINFISVVRRPLESIL